MNPEEARRRFASARVARLATVGAPGAPHLVPFVFVVIGDTIYSAVDAKPKRSTALRRLANVAAHPAVAALVDHYDEDWDALWWVRADGVGRVLEVEDRQAAEAVDALAERYPQYREQRPSGQVLAIDVGRWTGWSAGLGPQPAPGPAAPG